jgi:ABC-type glycerol-3-phosphate transport system permease component
LNPQLHIPVVVTLSAILTTGELPLFYLQADNRNADSILIFGTIWLRSDTLLMAAVVFVTLPGVLLFFLGQKQFIKGIATSRPK